MAGPLGIIGRWRAREWPAVGAPRPRNWQDRDVDYSSSELDLLGNAERVVHLDAEVADCAFEFRMPEEKLDRPQIARLLIDLCRLRPPHRMRAVGGTIKSGTLDPP